MTVVLYARVSTSEQTLAHQRTDAESKGFVFDQVVSDHGESGRKRLRDRPEGRRLYDMLREGDVLVVRWVNRLGRNYEDVVDVMRELMRRGVTVRTVTQNLTFDGTTRDPMLRAVRDAMISFMAAAAEAELEATREAQTAGIAHAKAQTDRTAYRGRKPSYSREQLTLISGMLGQGAGISAIAKATGLTRQAIYRVQADQVEAEAALARWAA